MLRTLLMLALFGLCGADKCPNNQYFTCIGPYSANCTGSCHCTDGYGRDANGTCVSTAPPPIDNHPSPPPPITPSPVTTPTEAPPGPKLKCENATRHEILACRFGCPPERSCQNRHWPPPSCAPPAPWLKCTNKCICDNGYVRNEPSGICVTEEQCDKCPGENEYFQCDGENEADCEGHCYCLSNYVRDMDGKCVYVDPASPPKILGPPLATTTENPQCPKLTCDNATRHETLACVHGCPPERSCQNRFWPPLPCAPPGPEIICTDKCICDEGYVRNEPSGVCVTEEQCDKCPGENEYFQCDGENEANCEGHCYCLSNRVRDIDGKCVYVDPASPPKILDPPSVTTTETPQSPEPVSCDNATRHEVPSCVYICPRERTCQSRHWPHTTCPPPSLIECKNKCVCDAGYIRNKPNGQCITAEQCDKCPGISQYFACDGPYSENCKGSCHSAVGYE
ncbi:zonadhesin-like isoform X2 [Cydia pomonella]|uniref:zonadhesin-like isoform X2 n=1 Tax=Cydia pomonella TaxID=82600 RepID=UPI002ADE7D33|nr:zonadhesin-like isoform X2 [Cydia pomonella]